MSKYVIAYLATAVFFVAIDCVWLGLVMRGFYKAQLGSLLLEHPKLSAAVVFYALYVVGIVIFGIVPGWESGSWVKTMAQSALFGLIAYATYDLSNLATLKGWSVTLAVVDIAWGALLTGMCGTAGYLVTKSIWH